MLETICKEIVNENTFLFHFMDKEKKDLSKDQAEYIRNFKTLDESQHQLALRIHAIPHAVIIDVKIEYPSDFYHPNVYELLEINEKLLHSHYNESFKYSQAADYSEILETNSSKIKGK
jgi:hypothetical protein